MGQQQSPATRGRPERQAPGRVPAGYRVAFGIPYAQQRDGHVQCPRCDERIALVARKDFESFTGEEYATHYNTAHAADDGRILVGGEWFEKVEAS